MKEHKVMFERGYDCINFECAHGSEDCKPGEGGSHGKHGMNIRFLVKGEEGAVQFLLFTGWIPQYSEGKFGKYVRLDGHCTMPADLGYHSRVPHYEEQTSMGACEYLDGEDCYYDGSSLNAEYAMYTLINGGEDALWKYLDKYYDSVFSSGDYPVPAEYPFKRRKK